MTEYNYEFSILGINDEYNYELLGYDNGGISIEEFNRNAAEKTNEFNENYQEKLDDFNENAEELQNQLNVTNKKVSTLENASIKVSDESSNIELDDTAKGVVMDFELQGKTTQDTRSGKNKLKNELTSQTINGLTITVNNDKSVTINGTANNRTVLWLNELFELSAGTYKLTGCPTGGIKNSSYWFSIFSENYAGIVDDTGNGGTFTLNSIQKIRAVFYILSGQTLNSFVIKPMICSSTEIDTTYEQYGVQPSPDYPSELKSVGYENLFDKDTYLLNAALSTDGTNKIISSNGFYLFYLPVEYGNTYKMNFNATGEQMGNVLFGYCNTLPNIGTDCQYNVVYITNLNNYIFTPTDSEQKYLCIRLSYENQYPNMSNIMITEGTQVHSYIPYGKYGIEVVSHDDNNNSSTTLFTLNEPLREWDRLYYENGKVFVERGTGDIVLDGSENWTTRFSNTIRLFETVVSPAGINSTNPDFNKCFSNYFVGNIYLTNNHEMRIIGPTITIHNDDFSTVNEFKSWLSTHNTEVQYQLATPTIETLGYIDMPVTYSGKTYIETTDELEPNMRVTAVYDLNKLLTRVEVLESEV